MTFLSMGGGPKRSETCNPLPAGTHVVKLVSLKYVGKVGKVVAEFETPDGSGYFTEWLGMDSEGQVGRLKAFVGRLFDLVGLKTPTSFETVQEFDRAGDGLVAADAPLRIVLGDQEYQGKVRQVLAGKFDTALLPAAAAPTLF